MGRGFFIHLEFISNDSSYKALNDSQLKEYLTKITEQSKDDVTIERIVTFVYDQLRIDIIYKCTRSRLEPLVGSYSSLVCPDASRMADTI